MEQPKTFNLRLHGIDLIEKNLAKHPVKDGQIFRFDTKTQSVIDGSRQLVVTFVQVNVTIDGLENSPILGGILVGIGFTFDDFDNVFEKNDQGQYLLPNEIDTMLKSISISTVRGILYSEFRGTPLHNAVLPIIVPNQMIQMNEPLIGNQIDIAQPTQ